MSERRRCADEGGFTLTELLVVVVLQAMLIGAIAAAFSLFLQVHDSITQRLDKSRDAQIAATYFATDAQAASGPEVSLNDTASCSDPNPPVSGTLSPVARFAWSVTASAGTATTNTINYVKTGNTLMRRSCKNATLLDDMVVAKKVAATTVTCSPTANCTGTPTSITIAVTETQDVAESSPYTFTLTAAFRKVPALGSTPSAPPAGPFPLLALNGSGIGLQLTGNSSLQVNSNGVIMINSVTNDPVQVFGSASISGAAAVAGVGTCLNASCPTNHTIIPQAPIDPYKGLAGPSTSGLPARSGCSGGTAQPGVYAATLTLAGSDSCVLTSGVYVFQNGVTMSGSGSLSSGIGGVFIYIAGGGLSLTGGGIVSLTAMAGGTYANILLYQDRTNATAMTLGGNGSIGGYAGLIYAPAAPVHLAGTGTLAITSVIAGSVSLEGTAAATVG